MKTLLKTIIATALLASAAAHAQNTQWQVQIGSSVPVPAPAAEPIRQGGYMIQTPAPVVLPPPAPVVQAAAIVESIQAQQDQRIRWGTQRGYLTEPEYRRLAQMQTNIEYNRRIAYADGYFNVQEQQFVFGQLNLLTAEIDTLMLNGNYALPYYQQYNTPIPVWVLNNGWVNGRYEIRADAHHSRAYRPAPQPPVIQAPTQPVPQNHPRHRNFLRDLLDPQGAFR